MPIRQSYVRALANLDVNAGIETAKTRIERPCGNLSALQAEREATMAQEVLAPLNFSGKTHLELITILKKS